MDSEQFDAGREGARRLHRMLSLYCALFCWKNRVDAVLLPKSDLYQILGVTRIKEARREWLEADIKDYFEYYFTFKSSNDEYFAFSRVNREKLKETQSYKRFNSDLGVISQLELLSEIDEGDEKVLTFIKDNLPFLKGTTSSTSHLMGILMSSLASGVISINDIFKK